MKKIVILNGNHLCNNPRVLKEADALSQAGFAVEVLGAWFDERRAARDRELLATRRWTYTPVVDFTAVSLFNRRQQFWLRLRTRLGWESFRRLGRENAYQLGYVGPELFSAARRRNADLYMAHSEQAMWAADKLTDQGHRVGVDMEDWFSEDLLPEARSQRPLGLLHSLERRLLQRGSVTTCTSQVMSEALAKAYDSPPPRPIYNTFPWSDRTDLDGQQRDRVRRDVVSIHWFSQTIGSGRGLEDLFQALDHLAQPVEVHLRGEPIANFDVWLAERIPERHRAAIHVHPTVPNQQLLSRIAEHDIGFAGELTYCQNKSLTISNKLFQYMLAGIAVLASDTPGQREVLSQVPEAGALYEPGNPRSLAAALTPWLKSPEALARAKTAALDAARERFCWEREAPALVSAVEAAFGASSSPGLARVTRA